MEEKDCWLGLAMCSGIGPLKLQALLTYFTNARKAWNASEKDLQSCLGNAASLLITHRKEFSLKGYKQKLRSKGVTFVTPIEEDYPELLAQIKKPPYILFIKGNVANLHDPCIAVVGTRKITEYGQQVTETLTAELAASGHVIVSGLALGVDAIAHRAAIEAGGKTIAVLGCGVDCCNPRENLQLYSDILKNNGTIIAEYALGVQPNRGTFPARNRIIAGLSAGVLVTEGAEDSGSLITAQDAIENNRKVFAVPGPITSSVSRGPISLIGQGAKIVTSADDILKEFGKTSNGISKPKLIGETVEEQTIIDLLVDQNLHFDELVKRTGLDSSHVGTLLSLMEMKGYIQSFSAGVFGLV